MASRLEDLDELTLRCRDAKARAYISEAVACYRAGAFRSSIVACWIAVCFDIIEKLRELALAGDPAAAEQVAHIENFRRNADMTQALQFERGLLTLILEKFQLISHIEYEDLTRLQGDRNRCAHPSMSVDDIAYAPPAELARLHIHSAVTHLLQHPPAQGKYALDRLLQEVDSEYFPTNGAQACLALTAGPLKRARESLVRSFSVVLTKEFFREMPYSKRRQRIAAALEAVAGMHHDTLEKVWRDRLSEMFKGVANEKLMDTIYFLRDVKNTWGHLDDAVVQRLQHFVTALPANCLDELHVALGCPGLNESATKRAKESLHNLGTHRPM